MTPIKLIEKLNKLIQKHPTLANVQVVSSDYTSIECVEVDSLDDGPLDSDENEVVIRIE